MKVKFWFYNFGYQKLEFNIDSGEFQNLLPNKQFSNVSQRTNSDPWLMVLKSCRTGFDPYARVLKNQGGTETSSLLRGGSLSNIQMLLLNISWRHMFCLLPWLCVEKATVTYSGLGMFELWMNVTEQNSLNVSGMPGTRTGDHQPLSSLHGFLKPTNWKKFIPNQTRHQHVREDY